MSMGQGRKMLAEETEKSSCKALALRVTLLAVLLFVQPAFATVALGPISNPANGHEYYLLNSATWTDSESEAVALGGTLAIINDSAENAFIFSEFGSTAAAAHDDLWIGLDDPIPNDGTGSQHAADFEWIDATPLSYTNWSSGEPNNDPNLGGEYYACMVAFDAFGETPGEWNDKTNTSSLTPSMGVVEVVPEPVSLSLIGLVALCRAMSRSIRSRPQKAF
jgi:hypothetical protein